MRQAVRKKRGRMKGRGKLKSMRGREFEARSYCEVSEEKEEKKSRLE